MVLPLAVIPAVSSVTAVIMAKLFKQKNGKNGKLHKSATLSTRVAESGSVVELLDLEAQSVLQHALLHHDLTFGWVMGERVAQQGFLEEHYEASKLLARNLFDAAQKHGHCLCVDSGECCNQGCALTDHGWLLRVPGGQRVAVTVVLVSDGMTSVPIVPPSPTWPKAFASRFSLVRLRIQLACTSPIPARTTRPSLVFH